MFPQRTRTVFEIITSIIFNVFLLNLISISTIIYISSWIRWSLQELDFLLFLIFFFCISSNFRISWSWLFCWNLRGMQRYRTFASNFARKLIRRREYTIPIILICNLIPLNRPLLNSIIIPFQFLHLLAIFFSLCRLMIRMPSFSLSFICLCHSKLQL